MNPLDWTNATKAAILALAVSGMGLLVAFGVPLTADQQGAVLGFVGAAYGLYVLATRERSPRWASTTPQPEPEPEQEDTEPRYTLTELETVLQSAFETMAAPVDMKSKIVPPRPDAGADNTA